LLGTMGMRVSASQSRAVVSAATVSTRRPSGLKTALLTELVWPWKMTRSMPVSKLASRRLKREIERRGTLGEFALEPNPSHLKRIPPEESGSDLFRSDGPNAIALSLPG
jgi:hypothetical protein